jgi:hypothetical protein
METPINKEIKMQKKPLVVETGEHTVKVLLTCGHYSHDGKSNSGSWTHHPEEPDFCETCNSEMQLDLELQADLYEWLEELYS